MTKQREAEADRMEKTAVMVAASKEVLKDLDQIIEHAVSNLAQPVGRHAYLSLSGSFAAQVRSTIMLLQQNYQSLEGRGVNQDRLKQIKKSLDNMVKKLELLNMVKAEM
jgi:tetrahydromethanopterin S-methyltransferase subunit G